MEIRYDIPVPALRPQGRSETRGRAPKWPWRETQPGGSFFVPGHSTNPNNTEDMPHFHAQFWKKAIPGSQWTLRNVEENGVKGVRVWRVK